MARTASVCEPETPNAAAFGVALAVGILAIQGGEDVNTYKQHIDTNEQFEEGLGDFTRDRLENLGHL